MGRWHRGDWRVLILVVLGLGACTPASSPGVPLSVQHNGFLAPATFQETDVLGTWQSVFTQYQTNTLILTADHRFIQRHETSSPDDHYEGKGTWSIERRVSGCVYLYLEGMRFFDAGKDFAANGHRHTPNGEPYFFLERCENVRIPMPDKLILVVADRPTWTRGIGLIYPVTSSPTPSEESLRIIADMQGQVIPTPTAIGR